MTFLCMIALGSKTVFHTFLPSFDNANDRLCHERLLRNRNFVSMVRWRHTSPFYCVTRGLGRREEKRNRAANCSKGKRSNDPPSIFPRAHVLLNGFLRLLVCLEKISVLSQLNISVIPFRSLKKGRELKWVFICSLQQVRLSKVALLLSRY